jgi:hypothetical protein
MMFMKIKHKPITSIILPINLIIYFTGFGIILQSDTGIITIAE